MMLDNEKLKTLEEAQIARDLCRRQAKTFVLTNGCFDILHPGHVFYLQKAAQKGHCLWIALNSISSIQKNKGPNRPIQGDEERAYLLAALGCVDGITIFTGQRLTSEILALRPDIYIKSGEYTLDTLNREERQALEHIGANIQFVPFLSGFSTTKLIQRVTLREKRD